MKNQFLKMVSILVMVILLFSGTAVLAAPLQAISSYQATNDATNVYYQLSYAAPYSFFRVYIDTDQSSASGFVANGIGADFLLEGAELYSYSGTGGGWGWTWLKTVTYTNAGDAAGWTVARSDIGETADPNAADLVFQVEAPLTSSAKYTHVYSGSPVTSTPSPTSLPATIFNEQASNDSTDVAYGFSYTGSFSSFRVYIDTDQSSASGFVANGIGADFLLENAELYSYSGTGGGWGWTWLKAVTYTNAGGAAGWTVARSDIGETANPNYADLVFQVEAPLTSSAKYTHIYSGSPITPTATPTSPGTTIYNQYANDDSASVGYGFSYTGSFTFHRVYIDTDQSTSTGFVANGIGADFLLEDANLYSYSGTGGGWGWTWLKAVTYTNAGGAAGWTVARSDIGETANPNYADLVFQVEAPLTSSPKYTHTYSGSPVTPTPTPTSPPATIFSQQASNDGTTIDYGFSYTGPFSSFRVYIDTDQSSASGFVANGIGADFLLEGAELYSYSGTGGGWGWTWLKAVAYSNAGGTVSWTVARSDIGETANPNYADLVFQAEAPIISTTKYTHAYTPGNSTEVVYSSTTDVIANPERGFYHMDQGAGARCDNKRFNQKTLAKYRTHEQITLVLCNFYLTEFKTGPISHAALNHLRTQFKIVRAAGLKVILRFAYTTSQTGDDANVTQVLAHIDQLAPIIRANSDVIYLWQSSFIGAWGEGYYTQNFGNLGVISPADWANRKAVLDRQLAVLPNTRMVSLRTPLFKTSMYGAAALTSGQAFDGSPVARIGHHNDAFLASSDDFGTYTNTAVQYPWLETETLYLPMGGETAGLNPPRSDCPTALQEMGMFHWSYIGIDWYVPNIEAWTGQGCLDTMKRQLGYRFELQQGTYPNKATAGKGLTVNITVKNVGFAAPFNPRSLELILRSNSTGKLYRFPLASDPRFWLAGTTITINQTIQLQGVPAGKYTLLLNLPDPDRRLGSRPAYSIRFANAGGVWEAGTGFNNLLHTVRIVKH